MSLMPRRFDVDALFSPTRCRARCCCSLLMLAFVAARRHTRLPGEDAT